MGYDRVKLWLDKSKCGDGADYVSGYLKNAREEYDEDTGIVTKYGKIGSMRVRIFPSGFSFVGSLPKFYFGDNLHGLSLQDTAKAFERLSDKLHIKMDDARVTQMEFGCNFIMDNPVSDYLYRLGTIPRMSRCTYEEESLCYRQKSKNKEIAFYDKMKEANSKKTRIPEEFAGTNLLRYEIRDKGRLSRVFNVPEVTVSTLKQENFYSKVWQRYRDTYTSIQKKSLDSFDMKKNECVTVKEAYNMYLGELAKKAGKDAPEDFMRRAKESGILPDRKSLSRLKEKVYGVGGSSARQNPGGLIEELNKKILDSDE